MKKCLLFLLLTTPTLTLIAQRKIKYDIIKETGDTLFNSGDERLYIKAGGSMGCGRDKRSIVGDYIKSTVYRSSNGYMIGFEIQTGRTNSFSIYSGQLAELNLADGSVIPLTSRGKYNAKSSAMGYGSFVFSFYGLTAANIASLKNQPVQSIRVESSVGWFDYELKEKFQEIIARQIEVL